MLLFVFELELIQTQMTQKPMLRAEVYARALRASQNRKEGSVQRAGSIILPPPSKVETVHEIILKPDLSRFCVCFCIEESAPLFVFLRGGLFYSLPLRGRGRSSCPVKASYGSGAEQ